MSNIANLARRIRETNDSVEAYKLSKLMLQTAKNNRYAAANARRAAIDKAIGSLGEARTAAATASPDGPLIMAHIDTAIMLLEGKS